MITNVLEKAKKSIPQISNLDTSLKNKILQEMAENILINSDLLLYENKKDLEIAEKNGLDPVFLERLFLNQEKIDNIAQTLMVISSLDDPVGNVLDSWINKDDLKIEKISVPIGVIAVIYESRPNVTSDTAALCFKSGNVCILKGGREANYSNRAIVNILQEVLEKNNLPKEIISFIEHWKREDLLQLIQQDRYIDLIIPRGGAELNKLVSKNSTIPVIQQDRGLCHVYIHSQADISKALEVSLNSKCEYPAVCNAAETLLVDKSISTEILPLLYTLFSKADTKLKGCKNTQNIIQVEQANEKDFDTEYLDNILNIKIVKDLDEAILHINRYGTKHSESIITEDSSASKKFMDRVDASCVYLNTSTKFTDGNTFGLGAEVGIATSKLHARGPIGLRELTIYKYKIYGDGQIKVSWLYRFGYSGILTILSLGAILSFLPASIVMLPLGYLSFKYEVPFILTIFLGVIIMFVLSPKKPKFKILKSIFSKYKFFSEFINRNIKGLEQFSSLPSALSKMPQKGILLFKLLNITFWITLFTLVGYFVSI
jgi:glutamate-5-semialdehyde dehydrogenase